MSHAIICVVCGFMWKCNGNLGLVAGDGGVYNKAVLLFDFSFCHNDRGSGVSTMSVSNARCHESNRIINIHSCVKLPFRNLQGFGM